VTGFFEGDNDPSDCILRKEYLTNTVSVSLSRGSYLI